MLIYPQLTSGAMVQYPLTAERYARVIQSAMEDGSVVLSPEGKATCRRWLIRYLDLTDQEAGMLSRFFATAQAGLSNFLFLDPTANLLCRTEDFSQAVWTNTGLSCETAITDPMGTTRATRIHAAAGPAGQLLQQSMIPGAVQVCFSVYLRADTPTTVTIARSADTESFNKSITVTSRWQRYSVTGSIPDINDTSSFLITIAGGTTVDLFGPQVDAQPNASTYVPSLAQSGVYPKARFDVNRMTFSTTGPNRNHCFAAVRCNLPSGD